MREIDVNKDGVIDYTEFITAAIDRVAVLNKANLLSAFQLIDKDGSGMITMDELQDAFDSKKSKDAQLWKDIMRDVDKNGDNQISLDEFMDAMTKYLKESHVRPLDKNGSPNPTSQANIQSGGSTGVLKSGGSAKSAATKPGAAKGKAGVAKKKKI